MNDEIARLKSNDDCDAILDYVEWCVEQAPPIVLQFEHEWPSPAILPSIETWDGSTPVNRLVTLAGDDFRRDHRDFVYWFRISRLGGGDVEAVCIVINFLLRYWPELQERFADELARRLDAQTKRSR